MYTHALAPILCRACLRWVMSVLPLQQGVLSMHLHSKHRGPCQGNPPAPSPLFRLQPPFLPIPTAIQQGKHTEACLSITCLLSWAGSLANRTKRALSYAQTHHHGGLSHGQVPSV